MDELSLFFAEEPSESEAIRRTLSKKQNALNRLSYILPDRDYENSKKLRPNIEIRPHNSLSLGNIADNMPEYLPPEVEEGNIEYKRKLVKPTSERLEHLVTQMKWRLTEGGGEAIYRLGVDDDGSVTGLSPSDLAASLRTLQQMAIRLNATLQPLRQRVIFNQQENSYGRKNDYKKAVELLVRQLPSTNKGNPDLCIAVLGGLDAGKSTLVGVLSQGERDNGRGKARLNLFRHLHEFRSGRTSCSSTEVLGFNAENHIVNYEIRDDGTIHHKCADEVVRKSEHLITLIDLAGHPRYQKTTLTGLVQSQPVHVILVVSATNAEFYDYNDQHNSINGKNHDISVNNHTLLCTQDHAKLALLLGIPISVVVTKSDLVTPERLHVICEQLLNQLDKIFHSVPKRYKKHIKWPPELFPISNVTGLGLDRLVKFLATMGCTHTKKFEIHRSLEDLPYPEGYNRSTPLSEFSSQPNVHFCVTQVFSSVPEVPGPILVGNLRQGSIHDCQPLWIGPDLAGDFHRICVIGLQRNRQPHRSIIAGQRATMAIVFVNDDGSPSVTPLTVTLTKSLSDETHPLKIKNEENVHNDLMISAPLIIPRRGMVVLNQPPHSGQIDFSCKSVSDSVKTSISQNKVSGGVSWQFAINRIVLVRFESEGDASVTAEPPLVGLSVHVFTGNVNQSAQIVSPITSIEMSNLRKENLMLHVRFNRRPEYLEVGRQVVLTYQSNRVIGWLAKIENPISWFPCPRDPTTCNFCAPYTSAIRSEESLTTPQINLDRHTWELLEQVGLDMSDLIDIEQSSDESPIYNTFHNNFHQHNPEFPNHRKRHKKKSRRSESTEKPIKTECESCFKQPNFNSKISAFPVSELSSQDFYCTSSNTTYSSTTETKEVDFGDQLKSSLSVYAHSIGQQKVDLAEPRKRKRKRKRRGKTIKN